MLFDVVYTLYDLYNQIYFDCRTAANLMQRLCKVRAMKFTSIAELQPILCKDTAFKWNAHLKVYQKWFWFRSYCVKPDDVAW